jgi:putative ABC transport system substrate-binding protein
MRRRDFITLLGGMAGAFPRLAFAQDRQRPVIGFLSSGSRNNDAFGAFVAAFQRSLREQGYDEQRNVSIEYRWADGHNERLGALAMELAQMRVKLIAATGGVPSARAAISAASNMTPPIPVVFVVGPDPGPSGVKLVASLNRPGGFATGATLFSTSIATKRLETLANALQFERSTMTVGVIASAQSAGAEVELQAMREAAVAMNAMYGSKIDILPLMASDQDTIDAAFELASQQKVAALLVSADPFFTLRKEQIITLARSHKIPTMYPWREYVMAGGLMSYGAELSWGYGVIGEYAGRILKGAKPMDLPVQQPTKFDFAVNMKAAKALGLEISSKALPDEVIQ